MTVIISQCAVCAHRIDGRNRVCEAFPDEIPEEILLNKVDQRLPYEDDHGIRYYYGGRHSRDDSPQGSGYHQYQSRPDHHHGRSQTPSLPLGVCLSNRKWVNC